MFHIVSKVFTFFIMPTGIIFILLFYAICTKNHTKSKKSIILALIFFYLFSTPVSVSEVVRLWEVPSTAISAVKPHDIGILLTGLTINSDKLPAENIFLSGTSDRIGQTIQLYKRGKIKKVIISGGEVPIFGKSSTREIDQVARYLIISGIPKDAIYLEDKSTNTHENALNTARILRKQFANQSCILITSAFHMRRAVGCFSKLGINVTPYGSNYLSDERKWTIMVFLPGGSSASHLQLIVREMLGYISYWVFGWL